MYRRVDYSFFCRTSRVVRLQCFGQKLQGNNQQMMILVIMAVCSGTSSNSQRKIQFVSRLGISFPNMGFPPVAGCHRYSRSSILRHFLLQKLSSFVNSGKSVSSGHSMIIFNSFSFIPLLRQRHHIYRRTCRKNRRLQNNNYGIFYISPCGKRKSNRRRTRKAGNSKAFKRQSAARTHNSALF